MVGPGTNSIEPAVTDPVTSPTTTAAIPVLGDRAVFTPDVLVLAPEIAGMTGSTIRGVCRCRIDERGVHTRSMATDTTRVTPVIAGIVALGIMAETGWCPALGGMALVALHRRWQVILGLERRSATRAVAVVATPRSAGVVHPGAPGKSARGMAEVAVRPCIQMSRHGGILTDRSRAVMTRLTVVHYAGVIEACGRESSRVVADAAVLSGKQMVARLAGGKAGVVAGCAVTDNADMIESCWNEPGRLMAVHTVLIGGHMVAVLAGCRRTVVTGSTVASNALVIEVSEGKTCGCMTDRTVLGDRYMRRIDLRACARCVDPVVAGRAVVDDAIVIEKRRSEGPASHMAYSTVLTCHHVRWIDLGALARRGSSVVTGIATTAHHIRPAVVDKSIRKTGGVVADRAIATGVLMHRGAGVTQCTESHEAGFTTVAGGAVTGYPRMGEDCRGETTDGVAVRTVLIRRQMSGRFNKVRAQQKKAADMTAFATVVYVLMHRSDKHSRCKQIRGVMAQTALRLRGDVIHDLGGRNTRGMAGCTVAGINADVIEGNTSKSVVVKNVVAGRAVECCRQVIEWFAWGNPGVMTGCAITGVDA